MLGEALALLGLAALSGCSTPILSVDDAVVMAGKKTRLSACVEQEPVFGLRQDVEGVQVRFYAESWELGKDKTDDEGQAHVECKLKPGLERFEARAYPAGRVLEDTGRVFTWDESRVVVAVDIDQTIERTDYKELLASRGEDESDPVKRSAETLRTLARDYYIVYLTGRPRFLLDKSRQWLHEKDFPAGPVITAKGVREAMRPGYFKEKRLHELRKDWPTLLIGIGDKPSDADAYGSNGMLALAVPARTPKAPQNFGAHALVLRDWKAVGQFFEANRAMLTDPNALKSVIEGKKMLQRPVTPFKRP